MTGHSLWGGDPLIRGRASFLQLEGNGGGLPVLPLPRSFSLEERLVSGCCND